MHRLEDGEAEQRREKNRENLRQIGGEQELDRLADVVINPSTFADSRNDGGKVVVRQNHIGDILGDIGSCDTHADADIGIFDGRRVVDAVARHRSDLAFFTPCIDDAGLMLRLNARVNGIFFDGGFEILIRDFIKLRTGNRFLRVLDDAELHGDCDGGVLVVSGDHDGADAGRATFVDGGLYLRTDGIDHTAESDEAKIVFDRFRFIDGRGIRQLFHRGGEYAQRLIRHRLVGGENLGAKLRCQRDGRAVHKHLGAALQNFIRRSFGELYDAAISRFMNGGHHFPHGIEGHLSDSRKFRLLRIFVKSELCCVIDKRTFARLSDRFARFRIKLCVGAERHRGGKQIFVVAEMIDDRHFILRQRAGLVGADDLRTSERFDRGQLADDRVALRHVGDADGEHDRDDRRKSLRYGGDCEGDGDHKRIQNDIDGKSVADGERTDEIDSEDDDADADNEIREDFTELSELLLERRLAFLRLCERIGDFAHFGIHAGCRHDRFSAAVNDGTTHEHHIFPIAERDVAVLSGGKRLIGFGDRHGFARQRRFLDFHACTFDDARIRRDRVSRFENDDIPRDELLAFHGHLMSAADDLGGRGGDFLEGFDRLFRFAFLDHTEHRVDDDDCHDDDDIRRELIFHDRHNARDHGGDDQNDRHGLRKLLEKPMQKRFLLALDKLVLTVLRKSCLRIGFRQSVGGGGEPSHHVGRAFQILFHLKTTPLRLIFDGRSFLILSLIIKKDLSAGHR